MHRYCVISSSGLGLGETLTGLTSGRKDLSCFFALLSVLSFKEEDFLKGVKKG